jgi:fructosamine-3-kinase
VDPYVKRNTSAPSGFFGCEAAGLRWLAAADSGVPCVEVLGHDATSLTLRRLDMMRPCRSHAFEFGRRLAHTHAAGAGGFGAPPDGWTRQGFFGPMSNPLPMDLTGRADWGGFYADDRLAPMADRAGPRLDADMRVAVDSVMTRCRNGDFDDGDAPVRLHGDLWSGNVAWTRNGVVLIDPAAHGGHRETDLAMLALFGCPFYDDVVDGYQGEYPLRRGWRQRRGLHQLYALLAHVVLFGASYRGMTSSAIAGALALDP